MDEPHATSKEDKPYNTAAIINVSIYRKQIKPRCRRNWISRGAMIELREDQEESVCKEPQVTYFCGCGAEERLSGDHGSSGFGIRSDILFILIRVLLSSFVMPWSGLCAENQFIYIVLYPNWKLPAMPPPPHVMALPRYVMLLSSFCVLKLHFEGIDRRDGRVLGSADCFCGFLSSLSDRSGAQMAIFEMNVNVTWKGWQRGILAIGEGTSGK